MRPPKNRLALLIGWLLVVPALVAFTATPARAANDDRTGMALGGFTDVTGMVLAPTHDRMVITGNDRVEVFSMDVVESIAMVDGVDGAVDPRVLGSSVFVAARGNGDVLEISLADGAIVHRWSTGLGFISSIDVDSDFVWIVHGERGAVGGFSQIVRSSGAVNAVSLPRPIGSGSQWVGGGLVRVSPARPGEVYVGLTHQSPMWIMRYTVADGAATYQTRTPSGIHGETLGAFEAATDGASVWSASVFSSGVLDSDGATLEANSGLYGGASSPFLLGVVPGSNSQIVVADDQPNDSVISVFDRGSSQPRNTITVGGMVEALAISEEGVFGVVRQPWEGGSLHFRYWDMDYAETDHSVRVFIDGHGVRVFDAPTFQISCGRYEQRVTARYDSFYDITIPAGHRDCFFFAFAADSRRVVSSAFVENAWDPLADVELLHFDPVWTFGLQAQVLFDSPTNNNDLLIKQTYLDVLGRSPTSAEISAARQFGLSTPVQDAAFVLDLMEQAGEYNNKRAPIARLYRAFFLRDPDPDGIDYWLGEVEEGMTLIDIADFFSASKEFQIRYGSVSDTGYVTLVYNNVMSRTPDGGGYTYWTGLMGTGLSRGDLMMYFSDSIEYRNRMDARLFVGYVTRTLEKRTISPEQMQVLVSAYRSSGRAAVIKIVLGASPYFNRFWLDSNGNYDPGLRLGAVHLGPDLTRPNRSEGLGPVESPYSAD